MIQQIYLTLKVSILFLYKCSETGKTVLPRKSLNKYSRTDIAAATAAKSLQSCPTLCNPTDGSPLGSSVPGIIQARILEWLAISFSNAWKWKVKVKSFSRVQLLATPWTVAYQTSPSMGFSRQEYWSGLQLPSPPAKTGDAGSIPGLGRSHMLSSN